MYISIIICHLTFCLVLTNTLISMPASLCAAGLINMSTYFKKRAGPGGEAGRGCVARENLLSLMKVIY